MGRTIFLSVPIAETNNVFPRFCSLHARCKAGSDAKVEAQGGPEAFYPDFSAEKLKDSIANGRRFNVLVYRGKGYPSPSRNFFIKDGDWLSCIRFKRTAFFPVELIQSALERHRAGGGVDWEWLSDKGQAPKDRAQCFPREFCDVLSLKDDPQDAPVAFLEFVCVLPDLRGHGLVKHLLTSTLAQLKEEGIEYIVVYARVPQFLSYLTRQASIFALIRSRLRKKYRKTLVHGLLAEYMTLRRPDGFHPDWGIRFHQQAGGKLICGITDYANDEDSADQGALILYDLRSSD